MAESTGTPYRKMEAGDIARKYWATEYGIEILAMVGLGLVILAAVWLAQRGQFWSYILATLICIVVFVLLSTRGMRSFAQLQGILMVDCDPVKMVKVCEQSARRTKRGSERIRFRTLHAMSLALSGRPEEALELMDGMPANLPPADALNMMSAQAAAFRMQGDLDELAGLREHVQGVGNQLPEKNPLSAAAAFLAAQIDFSLFMGAKDYDSAAKALEMIESKVAAPEREVEAHYFRAQLSEAQKNIAEARVNYAYVAANGGTLTIAQIAQDWLDAHGMPKELESGEEQGE